MSQINKIKKAVVQYPREIDLKWLDTFEAMGRAFDGGAAEIPAYDPKTGQVYITNFQSNALDVLEILPSGEFGYVKSIALSSYGSGPNSVAVSGGLVAVVVDGFENADGTYNQGSAVFFDNEGNYLKEVAVGHIPDMVTFTPDGAYVLVANEAEPNDDYSFDPEGSVSVIDSKDFSVRTASFVAFNDNIAEGVRIFGPGATVAQDLEPEYITVSDDSKTAYIALQENNAIAVLDIAEANITDIFPLGTKDFSLEQNALDVSNDDDAINFATWPVKGFYMPDALESYQYKNETFLVTANEGDARDYDGFSEEGRVKDLELDPIAFPNAADLQEDENLGRLKITTAYGDANKDGLYEELYAYGARSFSIWSAAGTLVYDSKNDFEKITAELLPEHFNSSNDEGPSFDNRSDDKGPEPEGLTIGKIGPKTYAFIGLERVGGIMVYDISNPYAPKFKTYINNRDFDAAFDEDEPAGFLAAKDLGPEGLVFISAKENPTGKNLVVVANEVSGTTTMFEVGNRNPAVTFLLSSKSKLKTYPNPVKDQLFIEFNEVKDLEVEIEIRDLFGGRVHFSKAYYLPASNVLEIPVAGLKKQIYFVRVKGDGFVDQFRIFKE